MKLSYTLESSRVGMIIPEIELQAGDIWIYTGRNRGKVFTQIGPHHCIWMGGENRNYPIRGQTVSYNMVEIIG